MSRSLLSAFQIQPGSAEPKFHDIAPPVDVFPFAWWQVALAAAAFLAVIALLVWLTIRHWPRKAAVPPLTPRAAALRELEALRPKLDLLGPHAFTVAVSDIVRTYASAQYRLQARQQSSPELLRDIQESPSFSPGERGLLTEFLERTDLVKFARLGEERATSEALWESASAFVRGTSAELAGQRPPPLPVA